MKVTGLKKHHKLRDTEPGIGNQRPQKTLPKLPMLRNRNTTLEPSFFSMTWLPRCRSTTQPALMKPRTAAAPEQTGSAALMLQGSRSR